MDNATNQHINLDEFGPRRSGAFDFTLLFEDSFFTIAPTCLFLLAASARTVSLYDSPAKIPASAGRHMKTALLSIFVALSLTLLILWAITPDFAAAKMSITAASIDTLAAATLFVLSFYEHSRSVAPSTLIAIYLTATHPFDAARLRTLFLLDHAFPTRTIAAVPVTSLAVKVGILVFEAANKRNILPERYRDLPPEATSSPYSRLSLWWINIPALARAQRLF